VFFDLHGIRCRSYSASWPPRNTRDELT
jgi:hypothetical protein